jgi:hypothetical protein
VYMQATYWNIQPLDTDFHSGQYASLALDSSDRPYIAYYESQAKELHCVWWTGVEWTSGVVDNTTSFVGQYASLAIDPTTNYPRISYYDGDPRNRDLRYAVWNGSSWSWEVVDNGGDVEKDNVGKYTSLALDPTTHFPRISYYDATNQDLKYAAWNGLAWNVTVVDAAGSVGEFSSLALDPATGWPRIAYYDAGNGKLKYAAWNGSSWQFASPDPVPGRGEYCSLALDPSTGHPRISYYDGANGRLWYASYNGSDWDTPEQVDLALKDRGMYSSIALNAATGHPRISYFDNTDKKLKFAWYDSGFWQVDEDVDPAWNVGMHSSLRLRINGKGVIAYYSNSAQDLKVAEQP